MRHGKSARPMAAELLIDIGGLETRVALVVAGTLQELEIERTGAPSLVGNIYQGRVARLLPGMQAALVDIGLDRPGFLHVREAADRQTGGGLHEGRRILVQVARDPIGGKSTQLTAHLSLAARTLVMVPGGSRIGVSQRITDPEERKRLLGQLERLREALDIQAGYIVRTRAAGMASAGLEADMRRLQRSWNDIARRSRSSQPGRLVHEELPLEARAIRDIATADVSAIHVNDPASLERLREQAGQTLPALTERLEFHAQDVPLFDRFGLEEELRSLLRKRVALPSGGHIVIEATEAMTTVDVNSGTFLSGRSLEDTALATNIEAAREIPRQLRLRNVGGLVVIDFIEMPAEDNRRSVLETLEDGVAGDPHQVRTTPFSPLGLVELSRRRTRASLSEVLQEPCPACAGGGRVASVPPRLRDA